MTLTSEENALIEQHESKKVVLLGLEFWPMTENDRLGLGGAPDDALICHDGDSVILVWSPSERQLSEIDPETATERVWKLEGER